MRKHAVRRRVERVRLPLPVVGRFSGLDVIILDISLLGCRLEHHLPIKVGTIGRLNFPWEDDGIDMECAVVRCNLDSFAPGEHGLTVYHSGLRFVRALGESAMSLRKLISMQITQALEEQKANARGDLPRFIERMAIFSPNGMLTANQVDIENLYPGSTSLPYLRIARQRGYLTFQLTDRGWQRKRSSDPDQPDEGFTVWAYEDEEQLERLCHVYQMADESFRRLIRLCAELSLVVDDSIPPQRFLP